MLKKWIIMPLTLFTYALGNTIGNTYVTHYSDLYLIGNQNTNFIQIYWQFTFYNKQLNNKCIAVNISITNLQILQTVNVRLVKNNSL